MIWKISQTRAAGMWWLLQNDEEKESEAHWLVQPPAAWNANPKPAEDSGAVLKPVYVSKSGRDTVRHWDDTSPLSLINYDGILCLG